jgi:hypothetical protein
MLNEVNKQGQLTLNTAEDELKYLQSIKSAQ